MKYKSLEEIDADFKARMDGTEDADTRAVLIEQRAETRADFRAAQREAQLQAEADAREAQVQARERQAWIKVAMVDFPLAQQVPELIAGDTEEAVRTSAKTAHERISKIQDDATTAAKAQQSTAADGGKTEQQQIVSQATQAYGNVAVGGGNPPPEIDAREQLMQDYAAKWNKDRSGQFWGERRTINPAETDAYVRARGGQHMVERLLGPAEQKYGPGSPMVEAIKQQIATGGR